jgi:hypothetical protein
MDGCWPHVSLEVHRDARQCGTNPVWLYMVLYDNVATNVLLPGAWLLYCDNQRWHCTLVTQPDGLVAGDHAWVPHD